MMRSIVSMLRLPGICGCLRGDAEPRIMGGGKGVGVGSRRLDDGGGTGKFHSRLHCCSSSRDLNEPPKWGECCTRRPAQEPLLEAGEGDDGDEGGAGEEGPSIPGRQQAVEVRPPVPSEIARYFWPVCLCLSSRLRVCARTECGAARATDELQCEARTWKDPVGELLGALVGSAFSLTRAALMSSSLTTQSRAAF